VLTGNSNGFTADGLIAAKYNQKVQYWPRLTWCFHRNGLQLIRQLKDANGQYLWVPGGFGGEADKMLDIDVAMSEYAPNTYTTGQYAGILGDFSFYWIVDSETMTIQRLNELYAASNQTGFIARLELDGMPVLAEAFSRLKCN
jgi:HK97 family phage major capsid protein